MYLILLDNNLIYITQRYYWLYVMKKNFIVFCILRNKIEKNKQKIEKLNFEYIYKNNY